MKTTINVLIIDDEPDIRELLSITLARMGCDTYSADNVHTAYEQLRQHPIDLCLTDLKLPDGSGIEIVQEIQRHYHHIPVIVITAHGSMDIAIQAMKSGAFDFLNKPVDLAHLRTLITSAISATAAIQENEELTDIIGVSTIMQTLKGRIKKVARSQAPIYISGESGSGKELVARAIHNQSPRSEGAFIALNCGAIPSELMESELFGHIKGSFTGATQDKDGLFKSAENGTLFLDEVADLPLEMQVKLLRALQEKTIRPIGSATEIPTNVRILCATHKNLQQEVEHKKFRSDLFYRINVIELQVPPLRERMDDIDALIYFILRKIAKENKTDVIQLSSDAVAQLKSYDFPGNIRELENILERATTLCEDNIIDSDDLLFTPARTSQAHTPPTSQPLPVAAIKDTTHQLQESQSLDDHLENIEKNIIINALEKNRWNRTNTAKALGISFRSLRYRLKKLGLETD